jgi:hypothetical protein
LEKRLFKEGKAKNYQAWQLCGSCLFLGLNQITQTRRIRQTVELGQSEIRKESLNLSNNAAAVCADPGRPGVDGSTIDGWCLGICRLFSFVLVFNCFGRVSATLLMKKYLLSLKRKKEVDF